jgi:hypothetical protein
VPELAQLLSSARAKVTVAHLPTADMLVVHPHFGSAPFADMDRQAHNPASVDL